MSSLQQEYFFSPNNLSKWFLNEFNVSALTMLDGSLFHKVLILMLKNLFLTSFLQCSLTILKLWPRVLENDENVENEVVKFEPLCLVSLWR